MKDKILDMTRLKRKYLYIILIFAALISILIFSSGNSPPQENKEKPEPPSLSIGCDTVIWKDTREDLEAQVKNIDEPSFEWKSNGTFIGTGRKLSQIFEIGDHLISLNVTFNNSTISAKKSIHVIDSVEDITVGNFKVSKNQWGFQTAFKGKNSGVKGVHIYVDSLPPVQVNDCGGVQSAMLFAGKHTWKSLYHGKNIANGSFEIKESSDLKISKVEIAPSYTAGSAVKARIILLNTGSVNVSEFRTKTVAVNNDYSWMGDKARREYSNQYTADLKPGETYEIDVQMTIPEKVNGLRPSGKYTITISLLLKEKTVDKKIVNTVVK